MYLLIGCKPNWGESMFKVLLFLSLYQMGAYAQENSDSRQPEGKQTCMVQDCGFYAGISLGTLYLEEYDLEIASDDSYTLNLNTVGLDTYSSGDNGLILGYKSGNIRIEGLFSVSSHRSNIQFEIAKPKFHHVSYEDILNDLSFDFESRTITGTVSIWAEPPGHWTDSVKLLGLFFKPYIGISTGVAFFDFDTRLDQKSLELISNEAIISELEEFIIDDDTVSSIFLFGGGVNLIPIIDFLNFGVGYRYVATDPVLFESISEKEIDLGKLSNHKIEFRSTIRIH